tara:strand:- start:1696 stop:2007 length:312 start_codon:yes stop_codon:yes gene_type:complete
MRKQEEQYEDLFGNTVKVGTRVMCTAYWPNQLVPMTVSHFTDDSIVLKQEGVYRCSHSNYIYNRNSVNEIMEDVSTAEYKRFFYKSKIKRFLVVIPDNYEIKD